jgi:ZIP family zinc transporter
VSDSLRTVVLFSLLPVVTTLLGPTYATLRPPSDQLRSLLQHFAGGVVFSVVAVELLPDVTRVHALFEIGWTFSAGLALMLILERVAKRSEGKAAGVAGPSLGQLAGVGIDIFIDGLLIGIAFAAVARRGRCSRRH